jgi:hypothetical protein
MSGNTSRRGVLDNFRREWVYGHLDYQRAADALEAARRAASEASAVLGGAEMRDAGLGGSTGIEDARRRLAEVEALLALQFDRFCGVTE